MFEKFEMLVLLLFYCGEQPKELKELIFQTTINVITCVHGHIITKYSWQTIEDIERKIVRWSDGLLTHQTFIWAQLNPRSWTVYQNGVSMDLLDMNKTTGTFQSSRWPKLQERWEGIPLHVIRLPVVALKLAAIWLSRGGSPAHMEHILYDNSLYFYQSFKRGLARD